jgi:hypothetical protein
MAHNKKLYCRASNMNATVFCSQLGMALQHRDCQIFKLVIRPGLPTAYLGYAGGLSWHPVVLELVTAGPLVEAIENAPTYQLTAFETNIDIEASANDAKSQSGSDDSSDEDNPYEDDKSIKGDCVEAVTRAEPLLPTDSQVTLYELLSDKSYMRYPPQDMLQDTRAEPIFGPVAARPISQLSFFATAVQAAQELTQRGTKARI